MFVRDPEEVAAIEDSRRRHAAKVLADMEAHRRFYQENKAHCDAVLDKLIVESCQSPFIVVVGKNGMQRVEHGKE